MHKNQLLNIAGVASGGWRALKKVVGANDLGSG